MERQTDRQTDGQIAIHRSRYFKKLDGLVMGPGPFVAALEYASGVKAECVGKPEAAFFNAVLEDMSCSCEETVMVGDVSAMCPCVHYRQMDSRQMERWMNGQPARNGQTNRQKNGKTNR